VRTWLPYQGQHPVSGLASDKCAKRWPPEMLLQPGRGLSEETVLLLKKQEQTIFSRVSASKGFFGASIRTRPNGLPGVLWCEGGLSSGPQVHGPGRGLIPRL
jgi:hypothetical protein